MNINKTSKSKNLIKVLITSIVAIILLVIINLFTGNPISAQIAKHKISSYLEQVYDYKDSIETPKYNFISPGYWVDTSIGRFKYHSNYIVDSKVVDYFQKEIDKDYYELKNSFESKLIVPKSVSLHTIIVANGNYSKNFNKLKIRQRIYILAIWNKDLQISKENSKNMCSTLGWKIISSLDRENKYNITGTQIGYLDINGYYETAQFSKKPITLEVLRKDTKRSEIEALDAQEFIKSIKSNES